MDVSKLTEEELTNFLINSISLTKSTKEECLKALIERIEKTFYEIV